MSGRSYSVENRLAFWLLAPSGSDKRIGVARKLTRPGSGATADDTEMRLRLRALRQECLEQESALQARLGSVLAQRLGGEPLLAADARAAARHVSSICGSARQIVINRSATVQELLPHLAALGIRARETYDDQYVQPTKAARRYWEITLPEPEAAWGALATCQPGPTPAPEVDYVALLGVNAIAADDGAVFFAQHLHNIGEMLARASRLILLVGTNKIAPNAEAAQLITLAIARFGAVSIALSVGTRGSAAPIAPSASATQQQVSVIVLDNGRRAWLDGPFRSLFTCIGCRACAQECPTFPYFSARTGWTPRDYLAAFLRGDNPSLGLCSSCGRCGALCPLGIELPPLIAEARSSKRVPVADHLYTRIETLFKVSSATAPLSNIALRTGLVRVPMERLAGIDRRRQLPAFSHATAYTAQPRSARRVAYYRGCYVSYSDLELGKVTTRILEHHGYHVVVPPQTCCGVAAFAYGDRVAALKQARKTVNVLYPLAAEGLDILVTCPSCGLTLKRDIPRLLGGSPEAQLVAERTREVADLLLELDGRGQLRTDMGAVPLTVGYHVPCHLRVRGKGKEVPRLLGLVPDLTVRPIDRGCCGLSGSFGLKKKHYEMSMEIGGGLFAALREDGVQEGITDCAVCEMQMRAGSGLKVRHPLKLLWEAYGRASSEGQQIQVGLNQGRATCIPTLH